MNTKYTEPLALSSQFYFCGLPVRLDSYLGCQFQCKYCYALNRGGAFYWNKIKAADPDFLKKRFQYIDRTDVSRLGVLSQFLKRRTPIHFGGMSDPFQKVEEKYGVSKSYLKTLQQRDYPTVISTRSALIAREDYFNILKGFKNVVLQFSFSTLDDKKSEQIEPYSPKPSTLLQIMDKFSNAGIKTTGRWQPLILGFSEKPEHFVSLISSTGIKHLGVEHLKIPLRGSSKNSPWPSHVKAIGMNLNDQYQALNAQSVARELILPPEEKAATLNCIKKQLNNLKITFGCADNEFQYTSDTQCCCSGVDQFEGFENWFKFQIGYAVRDSINKRNIQFSTIRNEWRPTGSIKEFLNSHCRTDNENSIDEHLKKRWNSSDPKLNLSSFYNVVDPGKIDSGGYKIYKWKHSQ